MTPRHHCHEPQGHTLYCPFCGQIGTSATRRCVARMRFQQAAMLDALWLLLALAVVFYGFYALGNIVEINIVKEMIP